MFADVEHDSRCLDPGAVVDTVPDDSVECPETGRADDEVCWMAQSVLFR